MNLNEEQEEALRRILSYTLDFEQDHFENNLEEDCVEPLDSVDPDELEEMVEKYYDLYRNNNETTEEMEDLMHEIVKASKGIYPDAYRLWIGINVV
jgi:hypothetical protein